jgi:hypothetical protein
VLSGVAPIGAAVGLIDRLASQERLTRWRASQPFFHGDSVDDARLDPGVDAQRVRWVNRFTANR